VAIKGH